MDSSKQAFPMCMLWETSLLILWSYTMSWEESNMSITLANLLSRLWRCLNSLDNSERSWSIVFWNISFDWCNKQFPLLYMHLSLFFFNSFSPNRPSRQRKRENQLRNMTTFHTSTLAPLICHGNSTATTSARPSYSETTTRNLHNPSLELTGSKMER